ncbi:MAG: hypothetical protein L0332_17825 [Chloroflexi bacterium]|nr:hypothetical protein [Chloroflexota bacterium]
MEPSEGEAGPSFNNAITLEPTSTTLLPDCDGKVESPPEGLAVFPEAGSCYSTTEYEQYLRNIAWDVTDPGICITASPLVKPEQFPGVLETWVQQQVQLTVDGKIIPQYHSLVKADSQVSEIYETDSSGETQVVLIAPAGTPFAACYAVSLGVGKHTATLHIEDVTFSIQDDPKNLDYVWSFFITE